MNSFTYSDFELCRMQGKIFENSRFYKDSSPVFIRRFMYSDIARRMDEGGYMFESTGDMLLHEDAASENSNPRKVCFSREELYWIGYIYRYWAIMTGAASKKIFKIAPSREMRELYYPYHSLSPEQAIERILESKGISNEDEISKGVRILRRIKKEKGML